MRNSKIKILIAGIVLLGLVNIFVWKEVWQILAGEMEVVFFDVGQGDAIFIETPEGHQILIDGGPSGARILEKLKQEMPFWDRSLDLVALTHPDYDHLAGFLDVLDRYEVENILWTGALKDTKTFDKWLKKLAIEKEQGAREIIAQKGQVIKAGEAVMYVFYPFVNISGVMPKDSNAESIVLKLVFGETSFLFTGDITKEVESEILLTSSFVVSPSADILKVAHHGSKYSSSRAFLDILRPEVAVISCGRDNKYGHPHQEVLSNLAEFGIKVLRTDLLGDIKFKVNYEPPHHNEL